MLSTSAQSLEALKMRLTKTGSTFQSDITADHRPLLSAARSSTDQEGRSRPRMRLNHHLVNLKDLISRWRLAPSSVVLPISWESLSKLMRPGIMCSVLCCWMTGVSGISKLGNMCRLGHSQRRMGSLQSRHGLLQCKLYKAVKCLCLSNSHNPSSTCNNKITSHTTST